MTARDDEEHVAEYIERFYAKHGGRDLGVRTRHDGKRGLRVDFTYDAVRPAAALEVTGLTEPAVKALNAELTRLEEELGDIVAQEALGDWTLAIRVGSNIRGIKPRLIDLLHRESARDTPARFDAGHAPQDTSDGSVLLLAQLLELGLVSALRLPGKDSVTIFPPIAHDALGPPGFGTLLRACIASNRDKLGEARPRETHLVVTLDRTVLSTSPTNTPVPDLPTEIDFLWIVLGYFNAKWTYRLWRATNGGDRWFLLDHPVGQESRPAPLPSTSAS